MTGVQTCALPICGHGDFVKLSETQYSYYGYCKCDPGWFGDRCEFNEDDL